MGLLETIGRLLMRSEEPTTTIDEMRELFDQGRGGTGALGVKFGATSERPATIQDCRQMYKDDTRAKAIIQTLARDILKGGFVIETDDEQATQIANDLIKRLRLVNRLDDWARLSFRDGDCFLELGISEQHRIDDITRKPTLKIHRNSNEQDRFDDPTKAYWMATSQFGMGGDKPGEDAIWFADWQIVHARWDHDEGERYGTPLLSPARKAWKRMREGEFDVAVRRKTRAGLRFVHRLRNADAAALEKYKQDNKAALDDKFAALADIFMSDGDGVDVLQGDANVGQIEDVRHHVRTFFLASPVPMSVLGYGQDINYSVVQHQKEQYEETLPSIQEWMSGAFIWPILEIEWLLHGYLPESINPRVTFGTKKAIDADQVLKIANALGTLRLLGVGEATIRAILAHFLPGIEVEELPDQDIAGANTAELAQIVQQLGARLNPGSAQ
jgi:hypothetical protein